MTYQLTGSLGPVSWGGRKAKATTKGMNSVTNKSTEETPTDQEVKRWEGFTAPELTLIKEAVRDFADRILIQAAGDEIADEYRHDAALTLLGAANLFTEIDLHMGEAPAPYEVFAMSATLISQGKYASMVAEMSEAGDEGEGGDDDSDA